MKKFLKVLLIAVLALAAAAAGFIGWLSLEEYRPEDTESETVVPAADAASARSFSAGDTLTILSWNTGYASLDRDESFVMDGGTGSGRAASREALTQNLNGIDGMLISEAPDLCLLQEVDRDSARSFREDQADDHQSALGAGYASAFAYNYRCPFVPFPWPPLGKIESGIQTLSAAPVESAERIALPCPFSWPLRVANLKRCLLVSRIDLENTDAQLVVVNLHLEAYDSGEGKAAQTRVLCDFIADEYARGNYVIAGGDFNQTFPGGLEAYPIQKEGLWTPGVLAGEDLPLDFSFAFDTSAPSCRSLDRPLDASDPAFQYYVIDGFILSPNVESLGVQTLDLGFANSDHNPVKLTVTLCAPAPAQTPEPAEPQETTDTRDFTLSVEGTEETVSMTRTLFDLSGMGGPEAALYVDTGRFGTNMFEGEYNIDPVDGGEDPVARLHLAYFSESAEAAAKEFTALWAGSRDVTDEGMTKLGGLDAYRLSFMGGTDGRLGDCYFVPWKDGCVGVEISAIPEAAEGMLPRLTLSAATLSLGA